MAVCALCGREESTTRHHLVPRTRHNNKRTKREFDRETRLATVLFCPPCHNQIHALLTEKQLERDYHTVEHLLAHPEVRKFVDWIATKPRGFRCTTHKKKA